MTTKGDEDPLGAGSRSGSMMPATRMAASAPPSAMPPPARVRIPAQRTRPRSSATTATGIPRNRAGMLSMPLGPPKTAPSRTRTTRLPHPHHQAPPLLEDSVRRGPDVVGVSAGTGIESARGSGKIRSCLHCSCEGPDGGGQYGAGDQGSSPELEPCGSDIYLRTLQSLRRARRR